MDYEAKFKSLLKQAGFKMDGPYIEIEGYPCAVHVRPLKKRPEGAKVVQSSKEDIRARRAKAMLESVKETIKSDEKPSDAYGRKGFEKIGAAGVLTSLKNKGMIEQDNEGRYQLTEEGEEL